MSSGIPLARLRSSGSHGQLYESADNDDADAEATDNEPLRPASPSAATLTPTSNRFSHSNSYESNVDYSPYDSSFSNSRPPPSRKRELHALLERPTSSSAAFLLHVLTTSLIVISALVTVLETVPAFHAISPRVWFGLETSLVALFTVEYIARAIAWSASWTSLAKWMTSFFGIIDLLAILPYYIEIILRQDTSVFFRFSILRMFRLLRVFRPFRHNNTILLTIEVMYVSVRRSQHALFAIGFFMVMVLTVFSTLLYFAERGTWDSTLETFINSDGDPSQFASIPAAAWFVIVTITTVGYGEITPRSFLGRLITLPLLVFGLLLIALPSFVLGREFSLVWERMAEPDSEVGQNADDLRLFTPSTSPLQPRRPIIQPLQPHSHRQSDSLTSATGNSQHPYHASLPNLLAHGSFPSRTSNQELTREVVALRAAVEAQNELVSRLARALGNSVLES